MAQIMSTLILKHASAFRSYVTMAEMNKSRLSARGEERAA
jgi:hypothetical protein